MVLAWITFAEHKWVISDERRSNKGMKQTSVEHIGRSQLIPGVIAPGKPGEGGRGDIATSETF